MLRFNKVISGGCIIFAMSLLTINLYGLTQDLRPQQLVPPHLRFGERDIPTDLPGFRAGVQRRAGESEKEYAERLTQVIADGLAHIHWETYPPDAFHQRVPIWENYVLYFMGVFTSIPEYERYHFSNPEKSMERGIGICGDASILMSQLLSDQGINNQIITMPGHVVVEATVDGQRKVLDPDFGVTLHSSISDIVQSPGAFASNYVAAGYASREVQFLHDAAKRGFTRWEGPQHFITKKYYFEKVAYGIKWVFPLALLFLGVLLCFRHRVMEEKKHVLN